MDKGLAILALLSVCTAARVSRVPHRSSTASIDVKYPEPISMDRFEALLQRASQILRPPAQVVEPTAETNDHRQHSPIDQEDTYYLPMYHGQKSHKLDAKSRQLQYMMPPSDLSQPANFYMIKQKKLPKKFTSAAKHINVKVTADGERGELPPQTHHGYSNDHNIIFDDTFFGVDAQPAVPEEVPQEHNTDHGFIAPIYSRRLHKPEDMFATSALKREARMRMHNMPMTRFSIVSF